LSRSAFSPVMKRPRGRVLRSKPHFQPAPLRLLLPK
jgi:hypothetical protein